MNNEPGAHYTQYCQQFRSELVLLEQKHSRLGWLRLLLIGATAVGGYQTFAWAGSWAWLTVAVGITLFLWVVSADADNNRKISYCRQRLHISEDELRILNWEFAHRFDGAAFLPGDHAYAHDLDIFGPHSVYQLLNRCYSAQGRSMLAENLLRPLAPAAITERQEAVEELSALHNWRQHLQASAAATPLQVATERRLEQWLQAGTLPFAGSGWTWFIWGYTVFACGVAVAAISGLISGSLFSSFFILFIIIAFTLGRKATPTSQQLSGLVAELETLRDVLEAVEQPAFRSPLLAGLQAQLKANGHTAAAQVQALKALLNRFDLRLNVFLFLFLNSFLLWDVRQLKALGKWRNANHNAAGWFGVVAQFEVLSSLATLRFNQPEWVLPRVGGTYFHLAATGLGHPLLNNTQRIVSDFRLDGSGRIALVTGSNMAGKSTFLRSLGVNTVLAQAGSVVCAGSFHLSPVELMSSMRIADNLAENTSTFYAELKKLKTIIEAVRLHRPLLVLLDEILRGTNSLDRHTGSKALIAQLLREQSVAILATHDVELAALEAEYAGRLDNYHFDVQVAGQELYFDYKLKTGVCTNLNASVLMKKIGIEL